jgi:hypothetical protein
MPPAPSTSAAADTIARRITLEPSSELAGGEIFPSSVCVDIWPPAGILPATDRDARKGQIPHLQFRLRNLKAS